MENAAYTSDLPMPLREALEVEREPGEQILWTGQPDPLRSVGAEWGMFLFAIPWTAFALFWESMAVGVSFSPKMASAQPMGWVFVLFGLPFIGVGVAMLASPFAAMARARQTVYAVTDRRILFLTKKGKGRESRCVVPSYVGDLQRTERGDGSGDLAVAPSGSRSDNGTILNSPSKLVGIPNVREVERIIRAVFFAETKSQAHNKPTFGVGRYNGRL